MTDEKIKFKKASSLRYREAILKLLSSGAFSNHEISERVHLASKSTRRYISAMRRAGEVYVSGHRVELRAHGRGFPVPLYKAGNGKDAVFKARTKAQLHREYLRRRRADPVRYMIYLNKLKLQRVKPVAQPELAMFFGRAA